MTTENIAEKVVKDYTGTQENTRFENAHASVLEAPLFNSPYSLEDIQRFRRDMEYYDAEYVQRCSIGGSTLLYGNDHLFGNIRIFVESPDFSSNKTGKYCLVMYTMPDLKEVRRVVVGGAKKVSSWDYVTSIFHNWLNEILMTLEHHLDAPISDSPKSFEDMDELEQDDALCEIACSRDDEIREIRERLTRLSGGRLANYWHYAKDNPDLAEVMATLIKDLLRIGDEVLEAESELTGCDMCAGDGYYPYAITEIAEEMSCTRELMAEEAIDYLEDIAA